MNWRWFTAFFLSCLLHIGVWGSLSLRHSTEERTHSAPPLNLTLRLLDRADASAVHSPELAKVLTQKKENPDTANKKQKNQINRTPKVKKAEVKQKTPETQTKSLTQAKDAEIFNQVQGNEAFNGTYPKAGVPIETGVTANSGILDIKHLQVLRRVSPEYPAIARKRKEQGTVIVLISLNDGKVYDIQIEQSSGYPFLDDAALKAVQKWVFDHRGKQQARVPVTFKLESR